MSDATLPEAQYVTTDFPEYKTILFEINEEDKVATITINRPHAMNAWTQSMCDEFEDLWPRIRYDGRINAVVLRANMDARAFSTGADVKGGDTGDDGIFFNPNVYSERDPGEFLGPKMHYVWKPVICAIHGMCAGGAFYWVNDSDIVIASDDAEFFDPHVNFGLTAALEPIGLSRRMHLSEVLRIALMGSAERMSAETAMRAGLVTEVLPRDQLWERAYDIAATIASYHPVAVQGTVKAIWESLEYGRKAALEQGMLYTMVTRSRVPLTAAAESRKGRTRGAKYILR